MTGSFVDQIQLQALTIPLTATLFSPLMPEDEATFQIANGGIEDIT
jgi:hypothetical protein